jgi:hypothetical protein
VNSSRFTIARLVIALFACAALVAGCSSSSSSNSGAAGSGGDASAAGGPADQPSPGVSADTVNVGYLVVDIGELSKTLGFKNVEDGGYDVTAKGIQAVVNYVNTNGGAGGRKINPIIKPYTGQSDSPEYAEAQCRAFTQDAEIFAIAMDGQFQNNARPCYQSARAIMLDQTYLPLDQQEYQTYSPYLWSTSLPRFDSYVKTLLPNLKAAGWFDGAQGVAVLAPDAAVSRRVIDTIVTPYLQSIGVTNSANFFIDVSNIGTLGATSSAALSGAKNKGLDRVIALGGERIEAVALSSTEAEELTAKYTISSYDNPTFFVDNPETIVQRSRIGMVGLGFSPASDNRSDSSTLPFPDPTRPNEGLCKQIVDAAGANPPEGNRENYRITLQFCDATLLLKAALDKAPKNLTPNAFKDAMWSLGTTYSSAVAYGSSWAQGQYAGATALRQMTWDDTCTLKDRTTKGCYRVAPVDTPLLTN